MAQRSQFTFYSSIFESAKLIRNKAARADFYDAVCNYALNGMEPDLEKLSDAAAVGFISARPNLDASRKKAENGKAGGSANKTEANGKQTESKPEANPKHPASEKEKEKEGENEIEKEKEIEIENECYISLNTEGANTVDGMSTGAKAPIIDGHRFTEFWNTYPEGKRGNRDEAWEQWCKIAPSDQLAGEIIRGLMDWTDSDDWAEQNGKFIPGAAKFLAQERWKSPPCEDPVGVGMSEATKAYVQQVLARRSNGGS